MACPEFQPDKETLTAFSILWTAPRDICRFIVFKDLKGRTQVH